MKVLSKKILLILLFFAFISFRLFVGYPSVLLGGDNLKFMELSKRFPEHTLGNNQLYLHHAPIYPYAIYFFSLIFKEDYTDFFNPEDKISTDEVYIYKVNK